MVILSLENNIITIEFYTTECYVHMMSGRFFGEPSSRGNCRGVCCSLSITTRVLPSPPAPSGKSSTRIWPPPHAWTANCPSSSSRANRSPRGPLSANNTPPTRISGRQSSASTGRGASARHTATSLPSRSRRFLPSASARAHCTLTFSMPRCSTARSTKRSFFFVASTITKLCCGRVIASGRDGKPPPHPISMTRSPPPPPTTPLLLLLLLLLFTSAAASASMKGNRERESRTWRSMTCAVKLSFSDEDEVVDVLDLAPPCLETRFTLSFSSTTSAASAERRWSHSASRSATLGG